MITSKLPEVSTTIFSVMTALAQQHGAINLAQGFPDYPVVPGLIDLVSAAMQDGKNQYAPMEGVRDLRNAVADKYASLYGVSVDADTQITITPGATAAIYCAIAATVRAGDEVVVFEPAYDSYAPAVVANGGRVVYVPLTAPDYLPDWDAVRRVCTSRTAMIIINSPHNPTGTMWSDTDYAQLAAVTEGTRIVVLSDEVYELITFDGRKHRTVLDVDGLRQRSFAVTSFGKTFHATGWKVGCCVASAPLMQEFRKVHQFMSFSVNTPSQVALAHYMKDASTYTGLSHFFAAKRDRFRLALAGSAWTVRPCHGSYFQLLGYENISNESDVAIASRLTKEIGVAAIPLSPFYHEASNAQRDRVLRFCFAKLEATLDDAAQRLLQVEPAV